jgi:imidazolonepropionase-like amidohydrolase
MSDHPITVQRNLFYSLKHLLQFGLSRAQAISKITREPAEIIGAQNIGEVRQGFKASLVVWSGAEILFHLPIIPPYLLQMRCST